MLQAVTTRRINDRPGLHIGLSCRFAPMVQGRALVLKLSCPSLSNSVSGKVSAMPVYRLGSRTQGWVNTQRILTGYYLAVSL